MQLKINYQPSDQKNPFVLEALDRNNPSIQNIQRRFTVFVGPALQKFWTGRGNLIYQLAPKLYEALKQHVRGHANIFEHEDPDAFKFVLQWLDSSLALDKDSSICVSGTTMLKAFVFAERYGFESFFSSHVYGVADATYDRLCEGHKMADADMIRDLYQQTRAGSPIRRLVVDSIVWYVGHHDMPEGPREHYRNALYRADGSRVEDLPQFYEDLKTAFSEQFFAANLAESVHPFQRSEQAVIARYSYSVGASSADISTNSQGSAVGNNNDGAQPGFGQFDLVIR